MPSKKLLWLLPLFALASCANQNEKAVSSDAAAAYAPAPEAVESESVTEAAEQKIIRTADFRCKVPNVLNAATMLEMLIKSKGGYVQQSHISNENTQTKTIHYKTDSLLQATTYTTTANLILRIPSQHLDSIIYALPSIAAQIESRTLTQDDVTLQYLSNKIKSESGNGLAVDKALQLAKKSKESLEVQQYKDNRYDEQVSRKIANFGLQYNVEYATITVALSQPEEIHIVSIADPDYVTRTPLWVQFRDAIASGMEICWGLLITALHIWPLILMAIAGIAWFRKAKKKRPLLTAK
jgi:hypothetical protein